MSFGSTQETLERAGNPGDYSASTTYINVGGKRRPITNTVIYEYMGDFTLKRATNGDEPIRPSEIYAFAVEQIRSELSST